MPFTFVSGEARGLVPAPPAYAPRACLNQDDGSGRVAATSAPAGVSHRYLYREFYFPFPAAA